MSLSSVATLFGLQPAAQEAAQLAAQTAKDTAATVLASLACAAKLAMQHPRATATLALLYTVNTAAAACYSVTCNLPGQNGVGTTTMSSDIELDLHDENVLAYLHRLAVRSCVTAYGSDASRQSYETAPAALCTPAGTCST